MAGRAGKANGVVSRQKAVIAYHANPNHCKECGAAILVVGAQKVAVVKKKVFCGSSCSAAYNNRAFPKRGFEGSCRTCQKAIPKLWAYCPDCRPRSERARTKECPTCVKVFEGDRAACSLLCVPKKDHRKAYVEYISRWQKGLESGAKTGNVSSHVRRYLFVKFQGKCVECGWCKVNSTTKRTPLHVDHIDGNWKNNHEDNLRLLCPNCHSLTSTYGVLNKGKGRPRYSRKAED